MKPRDGEILETIEEWPQKIKDSKLPGKEEKFSNPIGEKIQIGNLSTKKDKKTRHIKRFDQAQQKSLIKTKSQLYFKC